MKIETREFQNHEVILVRDDEKYLTYWISGGQKVELFFMSSEDWDDWCHQNNKSSMADEAFKLSFEKLLDRAGS